MSVFMIIAGAMVLLAVGWLLVPLLRAGKAVAADDAAWLQVYRDRRAELAAEHAAGTLDAARFAQASAELEQELAQALRTPRAAPPVAAARARWIAVAVAVGIPVLAGGLYLRLGNPAGLDAPHHAVAEAMPATRADFEAMTARLAQRLKAAPEDAKGWEMLGRSYKVLGRLDDAAQAYGEAVRRRADDPNLLADYAEVLGVRSGRRLAGEPRRLLERALALEPANPKALALLGGEAFERKDYSAAVDYWTRLLPRLEADSELRPALEAGIARARQLAGGKVGREAISGEVRLGAALRAQVQPDDTIYVFARPAQGPRVPVAVLRGRAGQLPLRFMLDDSQAMNPQRPLSAFPRVVVEARISRSGDATPHAGDPRGTSAPVAPGSQGVVVTIDQLTP